MSAELVLCLAHMHSHSIVYRDLKPANVLIDEVRFHPETVQP